MAGSDCDTESCSTYRSVSEPTSSSSGGGRSATAGNFSPIYEEIPDTGSCRGYSPSPAAGRAGCSDGPPGNHMAATASRLAASPRVGASTMRPYQRTLPPPASSPSSSSVYYYSDTLRRSGSRGRSGSAAVVPSLLPETDSGISSGSSSRSSGHNTSSESTPRPPPFSTDSPVGGHTSRASLRSRGGGLRPPFPLPSAGAVVSSDEDLSSLGRSGSPLGRSSSGRRAAVTRPLAGRPVVKPVDTQVIDRNAASTRKQPAAIL